MMRIGIPKGLLYSKYHPFFENFFFGLGADIINSENTNKRILNLGVKHCVDEACLPVKIYHGHVASIKDQCDFWLSHGLCRFITMNIFAQNFVAS